LLVVAVGARIEEPLTLASAGALEDKVLEAVLVDDESEPSAKAKKT